MNEQMYSTSWLLMICCLDLCSLQSDNKIFINALNVTQLSLYLGKTCWASENMFAGMVVVFQGGRLDGQSRQIGSSNSAKKWRKEWQVVMHQNHEKHTFGFTRPRLRLGFSPLMLATTWQTRKMGMGKENMDTGWVPSGLHSIHPGLSGANHRPPTSTCQGEPMRPPWHLSPPMQAGERAQGLSDESHRHLSEMTTPQLPIRHNRYYTYNINQSLGQVQHDSQRVFERRTVPFKTQRKTTETLLGLCITSVIVTGCRNTHLMKILKVILIHTRKKAFATNKFKHQRGLWQFTFTASFVNSEDWILLSVASLSVINHMYITHSLEEKHIF